MSLEKKSIHVRLSHAQHQQLHLLATLKGMDMAALAGALLERGIVGEFHDVQRSAADLKLLGILRD